MTEEKTVPRIPLLDEVRVKTAPMPLYFAHWRGLVDNAFMVRQKISEPMSHGGLELTLSQRECVRRGVQTIWGRISARDFLRTDRVGVEEWLNQICTKINLTLRGSKPIERLQLVRTSKPRFLAYYASFYGNYMELVLYIDSGEDIDGASVTHLPRSKVDETTRDWRRLAQQLPLTVWVKEGEG